MRNPVSPDELPGRAVAAEVGERLQHIMGLETELPPFLKSLLDRLRDSEERPAN
ncbi:MULTISPECIES: hypothetical protein [Bradyrhizobium]|uniref:hypothetical protein n=1 Tax=Bradyrhizobium TaxID=374 RepID=UPI00137482B8|nr:MULTISPECIES: hypothetical protein [Bradyrhizobium]WOH56911.1 hypothetical protein RX329_32400 [Bradyrhizobium sp. BWC-3-1]